MYQISVEDYFALPDTIRSQIDSRLNPNIEIEIGKGMLEITKDEMFEILKYLMQKDLGTSEIDFTQNDSTSWSWKSSSTNHPKKISEFIWSRVEKLVVNS